MSYLKNRIQSFKFAVNGIETLFKETPNSIIQLGLAIVAIILGFIFSISAFEWITIIILIGLVLAMETMNTALERLSDYVCNKQIHPIIKKVKDLTAAAVLITAITALIVGLIIFLPKIIKIL